MRTPSGAPPLLAFLLVVVACLPILPQSLENTREQGLEILKAVRKNVEKYYFDPSFGGVDIKALFAKAEQQMNGAQSAGHTFGIVAQTLVSLNDSHTFFIPPSRVATVRYGWRLMMIGDRCMITAVKPGTDAEAKGVRAGDEVLAVEGYRPSRDNLWKMRYMYYTLQPRPIMRFDVRGQDGSVRQVEVTASIKTGKQVLDLTGADAGGDIWALLREAQAEDRIDPHRTHSFGKDLLVYRMPDFGVDLDPLDSTMDKARGYAGLILDLRGNGGGDVMVLERIAGYIFGSELVLAERKGRKTQKPIKARPSGRGVDAKLVVLVDSDSGSAAEILARAVQLEARGTVLGDRTSGSVRQSQHHSEQLGIDRVVLFGVSVTDADLIMKDGKSIEHVGVTPDELLLPTPADLGAQRDPVLARAAEILGVRISPEEAGKIWPTKWLN